MDHTTAGGDNGAEGRTYAMNDRSAAIPVSPKSVSLTKHQYQQQQPQPTAPHRRTSSGANFLSKLPFMRSHSDGKQQQRYQEAEDNTSRPPPTSMSTVIQQQQQQQKSRRRKGSLRKVALLGRGAQRERKEAKQLTINTSHTVSHDMEDGAASRSLAAAFEHDPLGLNIADLTPRPSMDGYASRSSLVESSVSSLTNSGQPNETESTITSPTISYTSTTDEDDVLHIPNHTPSHLQPGSSLSSGSESYFGTRPRQQSILQAKSPLSYSGLSTTALPPNDAEIDYSDTEWWGWVVLIVTGLVFVMGMGSVFGVWSWAWDVGTTPYAPPELEDDPTLPITGYYPALIILTSIMAWVWVSVAWMGMKYFRHAKISGE
ncbi:hypothetical protein CORC01_12809 [Colletotrichum orchidophilum]|uniref:Transmembrane protein n=1 Tax=Colletotrichum orchidophilum TaxID=1209926 RepID=A0A1G4ARW5_9PEZI|nr:uncharacterized protein CORC01_12809 [Colletotrichum orchidophilum]OHE91900.1 hypothetical protein CORC01_12809 [Colletotrichum orchidophilum]